MGGLDTEIGPTTDQRPDRGRAVRRDLDPQDRAGPGPAQPVELPLRAAARPRGDRVGQPSLRRADPGSGRRHAPPGRDRRRQPASASGRRSRSGSTRSRASSGSRSTARSRPAILRGARPGAAGGQRPTRLTFRPPSWRSDLEREIDLIEEVARIHGYEHIPEDRAGPAGQRPPRPRERVEDEIRDALTGCGFDEAVTFSLVPTTLSAPIQPGPAEPPRSGSSIRAGSARTPCGRAWCRACWPSAGTTRRMATPTPTCSRSPTSICPAPASLCPTSRPAWPWSAAVRRPGLPRSKGSSRGAARPAPRRA